MPGDFCPALEVDKLLVSHVVVRLGVLARLYRRAPLADFPVFGLVLANLYRRVGKVGDGKQYFVHLRLKRVGFRIGMLDFLADFLGLLQYRLDWLALLFCLVYLGGNGVFFRLEIVSLVLVNAPLLVKLHQLRHGFHWRLPVFQGGFKDGRVFADEFQGQHFMPPLAIAPFPLLTFAPVRARFASATRPCFPRCAA